MNFTDEINIKVYAKALLKGWLFLVLFLCMSIMMSLYWIKKSAPIFEVETIVEFLSQTDNKSSLPDFLRQEGTSFFDSFVGGDSKITPSIARLVGNNFLTEFVTQSEFSSMLEKKCQYIEPSGSGFTYFLEIMKIYKLPPPTDAQKKAVIVDCLASGIKVEKHKVYRLETNAYRISIQHADPFFASTILNGLVDFLFETIRKENIEKHNNTLEYLANQVSDAQIKLSQSEDELASFLSLNPSVAIVNSTGTNLGPYKLTKIKRLEKEINNLTVDLEVIDNLLGRKIDFAQFFKNDFSKLKQKYKRIERKVEAINKSIGQVNKSEELKVILSDEKKVQKEILASLVEQLQIEKDSVEKMVSLTSEFETLKREVLKRKAYIQSLLMVVQEKNFSLGLDALNEHIVHSIAVPPLTPVAPKPKLIVITFGIIFFLLGSILLILRQLYLVRVLDKSQIEQKYPELLVATIKAQKRYEIFTAKDYNSTFDDEKSSILNAISDKGKTGVILALGSKRSRASTCVRVIKNLAKGLASRERSVLFLEGAKNLKEFEMMSKTEKKIRGDGLTYDIEAKLGSVSMGSYQITKGMFKIAEYLVGGIKDFNNILIFPPDHRDSTLRQVINDCDFFLIVGKLNNFCFPDLKKIIDLEKKGHEKCAGIILAY